MLAIPEQTAYDLRFRLLGIPVRVHPWFWLVSAILGAQGHSLREVAIWVGCVFVSILVHEFGHGLVARAFGFRSSIVLYGMGGLCSSEGDRQTPWQRLAVLFAGPGAGFVLAGLVIALVIVGRLHLGPTGAEIVDDLLWINIAWGVLNLFPVWPLDGGQITQVVLAWINRRQAMRWTHLVSILTAGLLAVLAVVYLREGGLYPALLFGLFAVTNYQALQAIPREYARYGGDDADWWRR